MGANQMIMKYYRLPFVRNPFEGWLVASTTPPATGLLSSLKRWKISLLPKRSEHKWMIVRSHSSLPSRSHFARINGFIFFLCCLLFAIVRRELHCTTAMSHSRLVTSEQIELFGVITCHSLIFLDQFSARRSTLQRFCRWWMFVFVI